MISDFLYEVYILFLDMAPYLLIGLVFVAILNLYITKEFVRKQIGKDSVWSICKAAMFGVPLPLCSCGVIPITIYMANNKASKGAVTSFLISTPQTGIDSVVATYGMMGPIFGIFRPIAALVMGVLGGWIVSLSNKPKQREKRILLNVLPNNIRTKKLLTKSYTERVKSSLKYAFADFLDDIVIEFIVGLVIAGAITYFLPTDFLAGSGLKSGIWGMLLMVTIGIPMYVCATASIPIAVALLLKGFSPGVVFVFLVAGPATNTASIGMLTKSLGKKFIVSYLLVLTIMAIGFGYLLDFVFSQTGVDIISQLTAISQYNHSDMLSYGLQIALTSIFSVLLLLSLYRKSKSLLKPKSA